MALRTSMIVLVASLGMLAVARLSSTQVPEAPPAQTSPAAAPAPSASQPPAFEPPAVAPAADPDEEHPASLLLAAPSNPRPDREPPPFALRERLVRVDTAALTPTLRPDRGLRHKRLRLDLFDDTSLQVLLDRLDAVATNQTGLVWLGQIEDDPGSSVTLVRRGTLVHGLIRTSNGRQYEIEGAGEDLHRVVEIDENAFPPEAEPVPGETLAEADALEAEPPVRAAGAEPWIDVLVLYTPAARAAAGGEARIESRIVLALSRANQAYAASGVHQRLRLVRSEPLDYVEPPSGAFDAALELVSFSNQGAFERVESLRETYRADLVSLVIEDPSFQYCGVAWLVDPRLARADRYAFSVEDWRCIVSTQTLAHELGHNQGLDHDHANGSEGVFPYAYGYQDPAGAFRTVMAYGVRYGCARPCPEIDAFSNPWVAFQGRPTGVEGHADAALALNETAAFVAGYREASAPSLDRGLLEVPFEWIDVAAGQELLALADDDAREIAIGFPFGFYGQQYERVTVSSNGYLTFGPYGEAAFDLDGELPSPSQPNGLVAPYWFDLDPSAGGRVFRLLEGEAPKRRLTVAWLDVPYWGRPGSASFQVTLDEAEDLIVFRYLRVDEPEFVPVEGAPQRATIGIEDPSGTRGLQYVADGEPLDRRALAFYARTAGCGRMGPELALVFAPPIWAGSRRRRVHRS